MITKTSTTLWQTYYKHTHIVSGRPVQSRALIYITRNVQRNSWKLLRSIKDHLDVCSKIICTSTGIITSNVGFKFTTPSRKTNAMQN